MDFQFSDRAKENVEYLGDLDNFEFLQVLLRSYTFWLEAMRGSGECLDLSGLELDVLLLEIEVDSEGERLGVEASKVFEELDAEAEEDSTQTVELLQLLDKFKAA